MTLCQGPLTSTTREGRQCQRGPIAGVIPRTTNRTVIDPPPPGAAPSASDAGGGELRKLSFPCEFTEAECVASNRRLEGFPTKLAQQILDELNGRLQRGGIKTTPLAYLGGLINRARAGTFVPEIVRRTKQRAGRVSQTFAESPAPPVEISRESSPIYSDVMNNPPCQRVAELRNKAAVRGAAPLAFGWIMS